MNYSESINYINEIPWTMRKPGLHRIKELLEKLGRPDRELKFIHVAGTNGKGSVCAMLASVFKEAGFNTGLFTSPHLVKYNERMKVNGEDISDTELAECITEVSEAVTELSEEADMAGEEYESPSEFEILTAAGLLWFKKKQCDIVVLEVGLGGEFDSTNVIDNKELAIITTLGYEHTAILGNTMEEIAGAKAGIISDGCNVVLALQGEESVVIKKVVGDKCLLKNAELHIPDITGFKVLSSGLDGQVFESAYSAEPLRLNLMGDYQLLNALTVLEAVKVYNECNDYPVSEDAVRCGLEKVTWGARFEVLSKEPVFILDGAHNPHGINAAVKSLKALFGDKKIVYIVGMLGDKNIDAMLNSLYSNAKCFITLTPGSERALKNDSLAERIREDGFEAVSFDSIPDAIGYTLKNYDSEVICSLGSLYLAGEVRSYFTAFNT